MGKAVYIFNSGILKREDNTIYIETEKGKSALPINAISEIHIFGELDLNKRVLEFLTQNKIPIFFYNHYGYYIGSYYPREYLNSGIMVLNQAKFYLDKEKRIFLAKSFVYGAIVNMLKNMNYYKRYDDKKDIENLIKSIEALLMELDRQKEIQDIMAIEGNVRKMYYQAFNIIIKNEDFIFDERTKRPPSNPINALISFGNSLMYTTVLSQIYRTHLEPRIGYLHETNQRSFSLNLDLAEVFKPIIVDRVIFSLLNKSQIQIKHFEKDIDYAYLNEKGKQIFISEFENKLKTTIKYKNLGEVSYRRLIRVECYKLYKHFLEEENYKPFTSEW